MAAGGAQRRLVAASVLVLWTALTAGGIVLVVTGLNTAGSGLSRLLWGAALLLLSLQIPLRLLTGWRCRRAAAKLADTGGTSGGAALPVSWPGVRETSERLAFQAGIWSLRPWALAVGLAASGYLAGRLAGDGTKPLDLLGGMVSFAPAVCTVLLSLFWGPSGWALAVDTVRSKATLTLRRPLRRASVSSVSLPTIQGVELMKRRGGGYRALVIKRAKGNDWKLGLPHWWPGTLSEALAARVAALAGVPSGAPVVRSSSDAGDEVPAEEWQA